MKITFDRDERRKQKEALKQIFYNYDPKKHDAFVIKFNKQLEEKTFICYLLNRKIT